MTKTLTPEEQTAFFEGLLAKAVKPHPDHMIAIWEGGGVAVVTHELTARGEAVARHFGWKGDAQPFALPRTLANRMAQTCTSQGDFVTSGWLARTDSFRIFAIVHGGSTFLINYSPGEGYSLEPNSTDAGWKN